MFDDSGLFWDTPVRTNRVEGGRNSPENIGKRMRALNFDMPPYVQPELRDAPPGFIAYDLETDDPTLTTIGPAWAFANLGSIIGIALAWEGFEGYWPIGHREGNVDPGPILRWVKHYWKSPDHSWLCANAPYDIGWTYRDITQSYPAGEVVDVLHMAAILDEYRMSYGLDSISWSYLGAGKAEDVIDEVMRKLNLTRTQVKSGLKHLPGPVVAQYAAPDARRTYDLFAPLLAAIQKENLEPIHKLESGLIPMSTEMRRRGVRVNVGKAEALSFDIENVRKPALQDEIKRRTGVFVEPWDVDAGAAALGTEGIKCGKTAAGKLSIDAPFLEKLAPPAKFDEHGIDCFNAGQQIAHLILRLRKMDRANGTFLKGHILRHAQPIVGSNEFGRVHPEINQLKSEREDGGAFGTVTARYSITKPALQQIPVRDAEWGALLRSMFYPEEDQLLASLDYSSQEPRLAVHFAARAKIKGAWATVDQYIRDPHTDYHQFVADLCGIKRGPAKTLNLGLAYGMGGAKMARALGLPTQWKWLKRLGTRTKWIDIDDHEVVYYQSQGETCIEVAGPEAQALIKKWEGGAPFIRGVADEASRIADERGYILTLLGRRCRFPSNGQGGHDWTHKALNRLCQSSAADQTKTAMLQLWKMGICPMLTVHDELLFSVNSHSYAQTLAPVMVDAVKLLLPTVVDVKSAVDWGGIPK